MHPTNDANYFKEVARRLYLALDTQTAALVKFYGSDVSKWPVSMKEALDALEYATSGNCVNWHEIGQ